MQHPTLPRDVSSLYSWHCVCRDTIVKWILHAHVYLSSVVEDYRVLIDEIKFASFVSCKKKTNIDKPVDIIVLF